MIDRVLRMSMIVSCVMCRADAAHHGDISRQ
jgi:hypothetical protein